MQQKKLANYLKLIVIGVGICALLVYALVLPVWGQGIAQRNPEFAHAFWPWLIFLCGTGIPIFWVLYYAWGVFDRIGKDESFCHANADALSKIAKLALADTIYFFLGQIVLLLINMNHPGILLLSLVLVFAGLAVAAVASALSGLTRRATILREENELTI